MENKKTKKVSIPKNFFTKIRPTVSTKNALKDVIPIKWKNKNNTQKEKIIAYSVKEKEIL